MHAVAPRCRRHYRQRVGMDSTNARCCTMSRRAKRCCASAQMRAAMPIFITARARAHAQQTGAARHSRQPARDAAQRERLRRVAAALLFATFLPLSTLITPPLRHFRCSLSFDAPSPPTFSITLSLLSRLAAIFERRCHYSFAIIDFDYYAIRRLYYAIFDYFRHYIAADGHFRRRCHAI